MDNSFINCNNYLDLSFIELYCNYKYETLIYKYSNECIINLQNPVKIDNNC